MKYLIIIGNGFDLSHELYTSYVDLFNYCEKNKRLSKNKLAIYMKYIKHNHANWSDFEYWYFKILCNYKDLKFYHNELGLNNLNRDFYNNLLPS